jgi:hypothetical protein
MSTAHSLKIENKPMLFSYDLETEQKIIEKWVFDNQRYSRRNLDMEAKLLLTLASDFIDIINSKKLNSTQIENLETAIKYGVRRVWEKAVDRLGLLAFHFDDAKLKIETLIKESDAKTVEKVLNCLSEAFTTEEQIRILKVAFNNKSKKVRIKSSIAALETRNLELNEFLKSEYANQSDSKVKENIAFAIENMWQKKGELIF